MPRRPPVAYPIRWHPEHKDYGLDRRGRPVSVRVAGRADPRPLTPTLDRRGVGWIGVRCRQRTLRYPLPAFAAECRRGSTVG